MGSHDGENLKSREHNPICSRSSCRSMIGINHAHTQCARCKGMYHETCARRTRFTGILECCYLDTLQQESAQCLKNDVSISSDMKTFYNNLLEQQTIQMNAVLRRLEILDKQVNQNHLDIEILKKGQRELESSTIANNEVLTERVNKIEEKVNNSLAPASPISTEAVIPEVSQELSERIRRSYNVVLYEVEEKDDRSTMSTEPTMNGQQLVSNAEKTTNEITPGLVQKVKSILANIKEVNTSEMQIKRLGKFNPDRNRNKPRPLLLSFKDPIQPRSILSNWKNIPSPYKVSDDKTPLQQKLYRELTIKRNSFLLANPQEKSKVSIKVIKGTPKLYIGNKPLNQ